MRYSSTHNEDFTLRELAKALARQSSDVLLQIETDELLPVFVSAAYSDVWGRPCETAYTRPSSWLTSIHPSDFDRATDFLRNEAREVPAETEFRIVRPSGSVRWIWFRTFPVQSDEGLARRIVGIAQDCTQRKQDERSRGFLASIVESSDDSIIGTDLNGTIVSWNAAAERLFGYSRAEAIGQSIRVLRPRDSTDSFDSILSRIAQSERIERFESVRISKNGAEVDVSVILSPIRNADGAIVGVSGIYHDIRAAKREEMARVAMERKFLQARKLEAVGRLAAGIAHEINTPVQFVSDSVEFLDLSLRDLLSLLTSLRSVRDASISTGVACAGETLAKECEIDLPHLLSEVPKAVNRARDGLARVASIVRSTKEFAYSDSSGMRGVDLNRSIQSTLVVARNEYKYVADVETVFGDLPPICCNGGEINQAILNLIVNAAHAIGDVVAGTPNKGKIRVETSFERGFAVIRVQDTGGGVPDDIRERIFDPFFTTKQVGRGTGQGLAISRSVIVENHGGSLDLEVEPGRGTTFIVRLPAEGRPANDEAGATLIAQ